MKNSFKIAVLIISLLAYFNSMAQEPQWFIKNLTESSSKIIDFRSGTATLNSNPLSIDDDYDFVYDYKEGHNAIYDDNGDLEIFITNNEVFDGDGNYLNTLVSHTGSYFDDYADEYYQYDHDLVVVKVPEECDRYYIIRYSMEGGHRNVLHYYLYDTNLNAMIDEATGDPYPVDYWVNGILIKSIYVPKRIVSFNRNLSISKRNNDGNRYLFFEHMTDGTFGTGGTIVHKAKVTSSGITYDGEVYAITIGQGSKTNETEVMQLSSGEYLYSTCSYISSSPGEDSYGIILRLDNDANLLTEDIFTVNGKIKGMEFSSNGEYLYVTHTDAPYLNYVEVASPGIVLDLAPSFETAAEAGYYSVHKDDYKFSSVEVAHNGKMYYAGTNGISSLSDPNDPTSIWQNNEIPVIVDELTRGFAYHETVRLIPLPVQIDNEFDYAPIEIPNFVSSNCAGTFEEICVEDYPGYTYKWGQAGGILVIGSGPCFTPGPPGNYWFTVIDENGCETTQYFSAVLSMIIIPTPDDIYWCDDTNSLPPLFVGWEDNPLEDYDCFSYIHWTLDGVPLPEYNHEHEIPYLGDGIYCAEFSLSGTIVTRCFEVLECCPPNPEFRIAWYMGVNPYTIEVENYAPFVGEYDSEVFILSKDCTGDGIPGPWTFVEMVARDGADMTDPYLFENLDPHCLYRVMHGVSKNCLMMSFIHTEYVGGSYGISAPITGQSNQLEVEKENFTVYPNPSSGEVNIILPTDEMNSKIVVMDILGKVISSTQLQDSNRASIDLSSNPSGIYFVNVWTEGEVSSQKIILEH